MAHIAEEFGAHALGLQCKIARAFGLLFGHFAFADIVQDDHSAEDRAVVGHDRAREDFDPSLGHHSRSAQYELGVVDRFALHGPEQRPILHRDWRPIMRR